MPQVNADLVITVMINLLKTTVSGNASVMTDHFKYIMFLDEIFHEPGCNCPECKFSFIDPTFYLPLTSFYSFSSVSLHICMSITLQGNMEVSCFSLLHVVCRRLTRAAALCHSVNIRRVTSQTCTALQSKP